MGSHLAAVSLLVPDYDRAIAHYCDGLGFELIEDTDLGADSFGNAKRWVLVAPPGSRETRLLLARAATPEQTAQIGHQAGGRVFLILHTDDFARDHARFAAAGAIFTEAPRHEPYGTVAVFRDAFGNRWDLLQPK
jgi:catechol 2,3-dioxygenase-like lactoylglutathione lyase family enzyme